MKLNRRELLDLYKKSIDEMLYMCDAYEKRLQWFVAILSALFGGTVADFINSTHWYHFSILTVGPILIIGVSRLDRQGIYRYYQLFLEAITVRSKLEQTLGLTCERSGENTSEGEMEMGSCKHANK